MSDSVIWRQFGRIAIDQPVSHPTTLMKLTTWCGSAVVDGLNEALLAKAAEATLLRCTRVRVDTTVVPADVVSADSLHWSYPDFGIFSTSMGKTWLTPP